MKNRRWGVAASMGLIALAPALIGWTKLNYTGKDAPALALLPDGKVLVTGGYGLADVSEYDPETLQFISGLPPMSTPRYGHVALTLNDGRVFVAGGSVAGFGDITLSTEIFDPWVVKWTTTAPLPAPACDPSLYGDAAALLWDGRAVFLSQSPSGLQIYDPAQDSWTFVDAPPDVSISCGIIIPLFGDTILVGAANPANTPLLKVDLTAGTWTPLSDVPGVYVGAERLLDGRLFFLSTGAPGAATSLVYSPFTGESKMAPAFDYANAENIEVDKTLPNGAVLVKAYEKDGSYLAFLYHPTTNTFESISPPSYGWAYSPTIGIPAWSSVLKVGEHAEVLSLDAPGLMNSFMTCSVDGDCDSGHCARGICCDVACDIPCWSCGLPGSYGKCVPEPRGVDLHGDCQCNDAGCSENACLLTCDGSGACTAGVLNAQCAPPECVGHDSSIGAAFCDDGNTCSTVENRAFINCAPYACAPPTGTCRVACAKDSECSDGFVCNPDAKCVPLPAPQSSDCGVAKGRDDRGGSWIFLAALGILAARRRR